MHTNSYNTPPHSTCQQPVKVKWVDIGSEGPGVLEYSWPRADSEKVSVKEKTIQDPGDTAARMPGPRGTPVKCRSLSHQHIKTHTRISQLHTDETPTARHSVMTHAVIAFPPAASHKTGNSGVHHYGASSRSYCRMERVRPKEAHDDKHNGRNGLISHTPMGTKPPLKESYMCTQWRACSWYWCYNPSCSTSADSESKWPLN